MSARARGGRRRAWALVVGLALWPAPAAAHHILGIPHYKYDENYPQIPYVEVLAQVGDWDLDFTYFPGTPRPGERVRFKLYVHDRRSGAVYREPLPMQVHRVRFLRSPLPVGEARDIVPGEGPERNDYKFFLTFADPEAYEVRVRMPGPSGIEEIPFPVQIGATDDRPLLFGAAGLLLAVVLTVGALKRRGRSRARVMRSRA